MSSLHYLVPVAIACMDAGGVYMGWLREHVFEAGLWLVRENDCAGLTKLLEAGLAGADCIDRMIKTAIAEKKLEAEALLLEFKDRQVAAGTDRFETVLGKELEL